MVKISKGEIAEGENRTVGEIQKTLQLDKTNNQASFSNINKLHLNFLKIYLF